MNAALSAAQWAILFLLGVLAAACSTPAPPTSPATPAEAIVQYGVGAPIWVEQSCEKFWDDEDEAPLCAVGLIKGTKNPALARSAAIARARTEMARMLTTQVAAMLEDYSASVTGGSDFGERADDEQFIRDTSKQITDTSIAGTKFEASYISPDGTYHAMISLDLPSFEEAIRKDNSLSEADRTAIVERAESAFDALEAEIEKQRQ